MGSVIRVTVELISARGRHRDKVLGVAEIANVGGSATRADYRYTVFGKANKKMHEGRLENMPRKQMLAWDLLTLVLVECRATKIRRKLDG